MLSRAWADIGLKLLSYHPNFIIPIMKREEFKMAQSGTAGSATDAWKILLVEDNPGDVELTEKILKDSKFELKINVVEDGYKALSYLRKVGEYAEALRPDMVILDLNMPKMDGYEFLELFKVDEELKDIPVMILTSTIADDNRLFIGGLTPDRYCRKPIKLDQFDQLVGELKFGFAKPKSKKWWWPFGR